MTVRLWYQMQAFLRVSLARHVHFSHVTRMADPRHSALSCRGLFGIVVSGLIQNRGCGLLRTAMLGRVALAVTLLLAVARAAKMTAAEKQAVIDAHNQCRCQVSPAANSMPPVTWDGILETVSQAYADTCPSGHNAQRSAQYQAAGGSG